MLNELPRRLDILQVYRGIGATLVVLFHLTWYGGQDPPFLQFLTSWIPGLPGGKAPGFFLFGHSGVDLFFTLSGFVMVWGYGDHAGDLRKVWPFLKSRFSRIYPAYWAIFLLTIPFYILHPNVTPRVFDTDALVRGFLLYGSGPWLVPPAGTLPFELALYIFFTLLLVVGWRLFIPAAILLCGLVAARWYGRLPWNYPILLSPYVLEFFLGALGAFVLQRVRVRVSGRWLWAAIALCLAIGVYDSVAVLNGWHHNIRNFAVPYFLLVVAGVGYELGGPRRYPWLLMLIGDASYSIYLTHYYLIWDLKGRMWHYPFFNDVLGRDASRALLAVVIIAIGVACWALIERPLVNLSRRVLRSRGSLPPERSSATAPLHDAQADGGQADGVSAVGEAAATDVRAGQERATGAEWATGAERPPDGGAGSDPASAATRRSTITGSRKLDVLLFALALVGVVAAARRVVVYHAVTLADVWLIRIAPDGKRERVPTPAALHARGGVLPPRRMLTALRNDIHAYMREVVLAGSADGTRYEWIVHYGPRRPFARRHTFVFPDARDDR